MNRITKLLLDYRIKLWHATYWGRFRLYLKFFSWTYVIAVVFGIIVGLISNEHRARSSSEHIPLVVVLIIVLIGFILLSLGYSMLLAFLFTKIKKRVTKKILKPYELTYEQMVYAQAALVKGNLPDNAQDMPKLAGFIDFLIVRFKRSLYYIPLLFGLLACYYYFLQPDRNRGVNTFWVIYSLVFLILIPLTILFRRIPLLKKAKTKLTS